MVGLLVHFSASAMRRLLPPILSLLGGLVLCPGGLVTAQALEARHVATDTLQPANGRYNHPVSQIYTTKGTTLYVFLSTVPGKPQNLEFTWRHPFSLPRPKLVVISLEAVQWVRTQHKVYEPVRLPGAKPQLLAWRRATGPRAELFDVGWPKVKAGELIPVVGVAVSLLAQPDSSKFEHIWFLRRPGAATMTPVPAGKKAMPFLVTYFTDAPELAATIRQEANLPGYRFDDIPALVARYNQLASNGQ